MSLQSAETRVKLQAQTIGYEVSDKDIKVNIY